MDSVPQPRRPGDERAVAARFEACWLAEAVRLRELRAGAFEDRAEASSARAAGGSPEARVLHRALLLAEREGLAEVLYAWQARARLVLSLLVVAALATGFGSALAVLGDGTRPVNVVWALGGLLGVHALALAVWFAALAVTGTEAGGALGRAWLWLASRLGRDSAARDVAEALGSLSARGGLVRWWLGAVTHGLWLAALAGATVGLVATLATRRYGFVWETTILPGDVFVRLVASAGWLPAQLGFTVPDASMVRASGLAPLSDEAARIAWSSWFLGCMLTYGIAPRLVLWALCLALWRTGRGRLGVDLAAPGIPPLVARLFPASERMGVVDPAPPRGYRTPRARAAAPGTGAALAVGLELGSGAVWPPDLPAGVLDAGVIDTREERRRLLTTLAAGPAGRLLVACDARRSPDRGSLGLIAELAGYAGQCRIWLMHAEAPAAQERIGHWREGLAGIGFTTEQVAESEAAALGWFGETPDGLVVGAPRS